jgi:hypothetical protein
MTLSTVALAAAVSYPAPFVQNGAADIAIVYGSNQDLGAVTDIATSLNAALVDQGGSSGGTPTGDFVQLDKSSDHINIRDALTGPFGTTVDDEDLEQLLADGEYTADDSDDFSYEQKITLSALTLSHFRDSDYEEQQGLEDNTPVVGINITDGSLIFNYSLDFLDQAESDIVSGDFDDFEGSDLPLLGKEFYVSDWDNGTIGGQTGTLVLLDSANTATVAEGETQTLVVDGTSYEVSISFIDSNSAVLTVNGEDTNDLTAGQTEKLADGSYLGVRKVLKLEVSGELGKVEFSIGSGKLELTHGSDVKINDDSISDLKAFMYKGSSSGGDAVDKIDLQWIAEDDMFITPDSSITLPGFGGITFSMDDLVRSEEEKITFEKGGDKDAQLTVPIKDGTAEINLFFANASGELVGLGEGQGEWLATSANNSLTFLKKWQGSDFHKWAVISYNTTDRAESYVVSFDPTEDTGDGRNETKIKNELTGETWDNRIAGDTFDLGDAQFTITTIHVNSSDKWVEVTAGTDVAFNYVFSEGGLMFRLPVLVYNATINTIGVVNVSGPSGSLVFGANDIQLPIKRYATDFQTITSNAKTSNFSSSAGSGWNNWYLIAHGENKDEDLFSGTSFNFTLDDTSSDNLQVSQVSNAGSGGPNGLENEAISNNAYEVYIKDDVAPRVVHYTDPDEDYVEIYYPTGDSETYAEVFLSEELSGSGGTGVLGNVQVMDDELATSGMQTKNLVIVGGTCVNSAAQTVLGLSGQACGSAWTTATGGGAGEWIIETFENPWSSTKVATLVAGWEQPDTVNAATAFRTLDTVDIAEGNKYKGNTATAATPVIA